MSDTVYQYRLYCETEDAYVEVWDTEAPTVCPNNNGHTIDTDSITVIDKITQDTAHTADDFLKVETQPREGDTQNFYLPNLCDRTSWYPNATQQVEFGMTDSGDHTEYNTGGTHPGPSHAL